MATYPPPIPPSQPGQPPAPQPQPGRPAAPAPAVPELPVPQGQGYRGGLRYRRALAQARQPSATEIGLSPASRYWRQRYEELDQPWGNWSWFGTSRLPSGEVALDLRIGTAWPAWMRDVAELSKNYAPAYPSPGFLPEYAPSFWEDPRRVARYYNFIQTQPRDGLLPDWMNREAVEHAYDYFKYRNDGRPWQEWRYLAPDDPARIWLQGIQTPPAELMFPQEAAQLFVAEQVMANDRLYQESLRQGGGQPVAWDDLPAWHKLLMPIMATGQMAGIPGAPAPSPALALAGPAISGALTAAPWAIGAGVAATVAGAGVVLPVAGALAAGALLGLGASASPTLADLMLILDYPATWLEQGIGALALRLGGEAYAPIEETNRNFGLLATGAAGAVAGGLVAGPFGALAGGIAGFTAGVPLGLAEPASREAGRATYEAVSAERLGRWANIFQMLENEEFEAFQRSSIGQRIQPWLARHGMELRPGRLAGQGEVWQLGLPQPVKVEDAIGLAAIAEARQRVLRGEAGEDVYLDMVYRFGWSGQFNDLVGHVVADPLNVMQSWDNRLIKAPIAEALGNRRLAEAFRTIPGTANALQLYRIFVRQGRVGTFEDVARLGWFSRWIAGVSRDGTVRAARIEPRGAGLLHYIPFVGDWIHYLLNMDPPSRVREVLKMGWDNANNLLERVPVEDVETTWKTMKAWFNTPLEQARNLSQVSLASPEGYLIAVAGRDFVKTGDEQLTLWGATTRNRSILFGLADLLAKPTDEVLKMIDTAGDADALARQIVDTAERAQSPFARRLRQIFEAGNFTGETLQDIAKLYLKEGVPLTPEEWRGQLLSAYMDHIGKWSIDRFGVRATGDVQKIVQIVKGAQGLVLLGMNPIYYANNAIGGEVAMAATGAYNLWSPARIDAYWKRVGYDPYRLRVGLGAAQVEPTVRAEARPGERALRAAEAGKPRIVDGKPDWGKLTNLQHQIASARDKFGLFSRAASDVESAQSARAFTGGFVQLWKRLWRRGPGYDAMPPALEGHLRDIDPRLPPAIYGLIEGGLNQREVEAGLFATLSRNVESFIPDVAKDLGLDPAMISEMLGMTGAADFLAERLRPGMTVEEKNRVFDELDEWKEDYLDEQATREIANRAKEAAQRILQARDAQGKLLQDKVWREVTDLLDESTLRELVWWNDHYLIWADTFNRMEGQTRGLKNQIFAAQSSRANRAARRFKNFQNATYEGIVQGLSEGGMPVPRGFLANTKKWGERWDGFFQVRDAEHRRHFGADFETREQASEDWIATDSRIDLAYRQAVDETLSFMAAADKALVAWLKKNVGRAAATQVEKGRAELREFQANLHKRMIDHRASLRDLSPVERGRRWYQFLNDEQLPLIREFVEKKMNLLRRAGGAPTGVAPGVPPVRPVPPPNELVRSRDNMLGKFGVRDLSTYLASLAEVNRYRSTDVDEFTARDWHQPEMNRLVQLRQSFEAWTKVRDQGVKMRTQVEQAPQPLAKIPLEKVEVSAGRVQELVDQGMSHPEAVTRALREATDRGGDEYAPPPPVPEGPAPTRPPGAPGEALRVPDANDLREIASDAGIATQTEKGTPYDNHLLNAINKDLGLVGDLRLRRMEEMNDQQRMAAAAALRARAVERAEAEALAPQPVERPAPVVTDEGGTETTYEPPATYPHVTGEMKLSEFQSEVDRVTKLVLGNDPAAQMHSPTWLREIEAQLAKLELSHRAEWTQSPSWGGIARNLDNTRQAIRGFQRQLGQVRREGGDEKMTLPWIPRRALEERPSVRQTLNMDKLSLVTIPEGPLAGRRMWTDGILLVIGDWPPLVRNWAKVQLQLDQGVFKPRSVSSLLSAFADLGNNAWVTKIEYAFVTGDLGFPVVARVTDSAGQVQFFDQAKYDLLRRAAPDATPALYGEKALTAWRGGELLAALSSISLKEPGSFVWHDAGYSEQSALLRPGDLVRLQTTKFRGEVYPVSRIDVDMDGNPSDVTVRTSDTSTMTVRRHDVNRVSDEPPATPAKPATPAQDPAWTAWVKTLRRGMRVGVENEDGTISEGVYLSSHMTWPHSFLQADVETPQGILKVGKGTLRPVERVGADVADVVTAVKADAEIEAEMANAAPAAPAEATRGDDLAAATADRDPNRLPAPIQERVGVWSTEGVKHVRNMMGDISDPDLEARLDYYVSHGMDEHARIASHESTRRQLSRLMASEFSGPVMEQPVAKTMTRWVGDGSRHKKALIEAIGDPANREEVQSIRDDTAAALDQLYPGQATIHVTRTDLKIPTGAFDSVSGRDERIQGVRGHLYEIDLPKENVFATWLTHPALYRLSSEQEILLNERGYQNARLVSVDGLRVEPDDSRLIEFNEANGITPETAARIQEAAQPADPALAREFRKQLWTYLVRNSRWFSQEQLRQNIPGVLFADPEWGPADAMIQKMGGDAVLGSIVEDVWGKWQTEAAGLTEPVQNVDRVAELTDRWVDLQEQSRGRLPRKELDRVNADVAALSDEIQAILSASGVNTDVLGIDEPTFRLTGLEIARGTETPEGMISLWRVGGVETVRAFDGMVGRSLGYDQAGQMVVLEFPSGLRAKFLPHELFPQIPAAVAGAEPRDHNLTQLVHEVARRFNLDIPLDRSTFEQLVREMGLDLDNDEQASLAYDALEAGANLWRRGLPEPAGLAGRIQAGLAAEEKMVTARRTLKKSELQQFSTPFPIAEAAAWAAEVKPGDVVLEPEAGTGNLVEPVHSVAGLRIIPNEIDPGRVRLLQELGYQPTSRDVQTGAFNFDAEGKVLPPEATVIIQNPPWGAYSTGRYGKPVPMQDFKPNDWSQRFWWLADARVAPGGRIVSVMPTNLVYSRGRRGRLGGAVIELTAYAAEIREAGASFRQWLNQHYTVRAIIESPPGAYATRGTDVGSILLVVDKVPRGVADAPAVEAYGAQAPKSWGEYVSLLSQIEGSRTQELVGRGQDALGRAERAAERAAVQRGAPPVRGAGVPEAGERPADVLRQPARLARDVQPDEGAGGREDVLRAEVVPARDRGEYIEPPPARDLVPLRGTVALAERLRPNLERAREEVTRSNNFTHSTHRPRERIAEHPRPVIEAKPIAGIAAPAADYRVHPTVQSARARGAISDDQHIVTEAIGAANRRGRAFLNADGTGLGKGREVAYTAWDWLEQGHVKRLLVTTAREANVRDLDTEFREVASGQWTEDGRKWVTGESFPYPIVRLKGLAVDEPLPVFDTPAVYMADYFDMKKYAARISELDPDGWIADEAHKAKNVFNQEAGKKPSQVGTVWTQLHEQLQAKRAWMAYFTASPGEQVTELAYLYGLGLWRDQATFELWLSYVSGALDERGYNVMQVKAAAQPYRAQALQQLIQRANPQTVQVYGRGGYGGIQVQRVNPDSAFAVQRVTGREWAVGSIEGPYFTQHTNLDSERDALAFGRWLQENHPDVRGDEIHSLAVSEWERYGLDEAVRRGAIPAGSIETASEPVTQAAGIALSPAMTEQVMRELKAQGLYMTRELWRGGMQYEAVPAKNATAFFTRIFPELSALYRDAQVAFKQYAKVSKLRQVFGIRSALQNDLRQRLGAARLQDALVRADQVIADGRRAVLSVTYISEIDPESGNLASAIDTIPTKMVMVDREGRSILDDQGNIQFGADIPEAMMVAANLRERALVVGGVESPIKTIIDHFGRENVALITGIPKGVEGLRIDLEGEIAKWQRGLAQVAVLSPVGDTGISLHDRYGHPDTGEPWPIEMIIVDYDWKGTELLQRIGRLDRADQLSSPSVSLLYLERALDKKFIATAASRLQDVGATSRGGAVATSTEEFEAFDFLTGFHLAALRVSWEDFPHELRAAFPWRDQHGQVPRNLPAQVDSAKKFLTELEFMHPDIGDDAFNRWMETVKAMEGSEAYQERVLRLSSSARGDVTRSTSMTRKDGAPLQLVEVKDLDGHRFGILSGVFMDQMNAVRKAISSEYATVDLAGVQWVSFHDQTTGQVISGMKIAPSHIDRVGKLFGASLAREVTVENALPTILAGHKIKVYSPDLERPWTLRQRKDGNIEIDGAGMRHKDGLVRAGALYNVRGFWHVPRNQVETFLGTFRIIQEAPDDPGFGTSYPSERIAGMTGQHREFLGTVHTQGLAVQAIEPPITRAGYTIAAAVYRDGMLIAYRPQGYDVGGWFNTATGPKRVLGLDPALLRSWVVEGADGTTEQRPVISGAVEEPPPRPPEETPAPGAQDFAPFRYLHENEGEAWSEWIGPILGALRYRMTQPGAEDPKFKLGDLDGGNTQLMRDWLSKVYGQMADVKLAAVKWGENRRDATLLNYQRQYGFDNALNAVYPYQFWYTRSMLQWFLRLLDKPSWFANYARLRQMQRNTFAAPGFPARLRDKMRIPAPFLPAWAGGGVWVDPFRQIFQFEQFARPWETMLREQGQQATRAMSVLQKWDIEGRYDPQEIVAAISAQRGPVWDAAMAEAGNQIERETDNPYDFLSLLLSPSLPISLAVNIARGTPERIGNLPPTRLIQAATALGGWATGHPTAGLNIEAGVRKALGWNEFDDYQTYRIDRMLVNMAPEGVDVEEINRAMIEHRGPLYDEALRRAGLEQALGTAGGVLGMPANIFPEGEVEQRNLRPVFGAAYDWFNRTGDKSKLNTFFDEHPEYEARLALYDPPDVRLKEFLVDLVWDLYNGLGKAQKEQVRDQLGPVFEQAFLSRETRSYDALDAPTLGIWARLLGGFQRVPEVPTTQELPPELVQLLTPAIQAGGIDFLPQEIAAGIDEYKRIRDTSFPNWYALQQAYFERPAGASRRAFLGQFPELRDLRQFEDAFLSERPGLIPYLKPEGWQPRGRGYPARISRRRETLTNVEMSEHFTAPLVSTLSRYFLGGERLGPGAITELQRIWRLLDEPGDSFDDFVRRIVRNTFVPATQGETAPPY